MKLIYNPAKIVTLLLFSAILVFTGCRKEISGNTADEELASRASSVADAESEVIFNEVFDNVMGVSNDVGLAGVGVFGQMSIGSIGDVARIDACPTVTKTHLSTQNTFPLTIVMDFGTGCTGRDGRVRSGKIITTYTNRLIYPGAKATTTFKDYKVDSFVVEGTHIISNQSIVSGSTPNNLLTLIWKVEIEGARLNKNNGDYTEWNSNKTITQVEGMNTPLIPLDDIYRIEGSANGKVKRNNLLVGWRAEITEPLIKKFTCRWIVKGVIKVVRLNQSNNSPWTSTLNYGNGECNNKAILTINGDSKEITLP